MLIVNGNHEASLSLSSYVVALLFITSCAPKYQFNDKVVLDNNIPNQTQSQALLCGTGSLAFEYTVNPNEEMGVFEIENRGSCEIEVEVRRDLPPIGGTRPRLKGGYWKFYYSKRCATKNQCFYYT